MSRSKRQWIQLEIQILPGSEPWVLVRHNQKSFKIPAGAAIEALLTGVQNGWQTKSGYHPPGGMVSISRAAYADLQADALAWRTYEWAAHPEDVLARRSHTCESGNCTCG